VRSVSDLCEGLAARGHELTVFTTDAGLEPGIVPARGAPTLRNGVRVRYFPRTSGAGIRSPDLESAVAQQAAEFDLIHVSAIWQRTGPAAASAARSAGRPYVISPRGALGPYSWRRGRLKKIAYYWWRERATLRGAAGFHYTSQMEADECRGFRFGQPHCVIPNSIDLSAWQRDPVAAAGWRTELGVIQGELLCLYAGRLHHKKGLDLLPEVFAGLSDLKWRLVLVGEDEDDSGRILAAEFTRRGMQSRVTFMPLLPPSRLPGLYSAADVLLMPSRHENFGNVAIEAAACGCHVIASEETGAAAKLAELGAACRLPRRADAWVQVLRARKCEVALPSECVERVRTSFSRQQVGAQAETFYVSLLK